MKVINKFWLPFTLFIICLITRLVFFGRYIDDWDGVNFAFALSHEYDVLHDQPHFHGYPVYMFVSWIIYTIWQSDIGALILSGVIFSSLALFPFYALAQRMFSWKVALLASILYILNPQIWLQAEKTLSDSFGLFFVITFSYLFYRSIENDNLNLSKMDLPEKDSVNSQRCNCQSLTWLFLGSLTLGFGIGVRISYMAFIIVWGLVTFLVCRKSSVKNGILYSFLGFGLGVLVWFSYLLGRFGLTEFFNKFLTHSDYHFTDQSYSVLGASDQIWRFIAIVKNIFAHSFGFWWPDNPLIRILPTVVMVIAVIAYITTEKFNRKNMFLLISIGVYVLWLVVVQFAIRQSMVLAPFFILIVSAGTIYFIKKIDSKDKRRRWVAPLLLFCLLVPMAFDSGRLLWINRYVEPPQVAIAKYVAENYERDKTKFYCMNTWRLFQYYAPEWRDTENSHLFFTSDVSKVDKNFKSLQHKPENILISSRLYGRRKYKDSLKRVKIFRRDLYSVAEYNWLALYELDAASLK